MMNFNFQVTIGTKYLDNDDGKGVVVIANNFFLHPDYKITRSSIFNDIAIVKIDDLLQIPFANRSHIRPACIPISKGGPYSYDGVLLTSKEI